MGVTERLTKMKSAIEDAQRQEAQIQGRLESAFERLKSEFGIENIKDAESELAKMDKDLAERELKINKEVEELEKKYNWEI
jgi:predicted  nucleic acid-binding Zn-ribbon protein